MAFLLFPAEVWEVILDKLVDSQDVLNTFRAYPELEAEGILKTKRHLWLFYGIIPHIATLLRRKEVLICREVCQQWSHGVDNFLENHPDHRAFDHESRVTGQIWIPPASPRFHDFWKFYRWRCINIFNSKTEEFYRELCEHPRERNPFVGRHLKISADTDDDVFYLLETRVDAWNEALDFVRQTGDKIWFFDLEAYHFEDILSHCRLVMDFLANTPNLKFLRLSPNYKIDVFEGMGDVSDVDDFVEEEADETDEEMAEKYLNSLKAAFPPLPHLETLEIEEDYEDVPLVLASFLMECYSNHIRRLELPFSLWKDEFGSALRNLTQLTITGLPRNAETIDLLRSLNSPNLWRLRLYIGGYSCEVLRISFNEILKALAPFPRLHSLILTCTSGFGNSSTIKRGAALLTGPTSTSISSIKSLSLSCFCVEGNKFAFTNIIHVVKFHFPSLEYLEVLLEGNGMTKDKYKYPTREEVYEFNVWEAWLPKLKTITLDVNDFEWSRSARYYTRKMYERHNDFDLTLLFGSDQA